MTVTRPLLLISPYWNVNATKKGLTDDEKQLLIYPYWNVNEDIVMSAEAWDDF